jgi:hypothetical protein
MRRVEIEYDTQPWVGDLLKDAPAGRELARVSGIRKEDHLTGRMRIQRGPALFQQTPEVTLPLLRPMMHYQRSRICEYLPDPIMSAKQPHG